MFLTTRDFNVRSTD
ncbi:hypothetical protein VTH06DRAFT_7517 [Thermothelomyces fergusii]